MINGLILDDVVLNKYNEMAAKHPYLLKELRREKDQWDFTRKLLQINAQLNGKLKNAEVTKSINLGYPELSLVGYGPSLKETITGINPSDFVLIADNALKYVLGRGLVPGYVVSIDPWILQAALPEKVDGLILKAAVSASHDYCKEWVKRGGIIEWFGIKSCLDTHVVLCKEFGVRPDDIYLTDAGTHVGGVMLGLAGECCTRDNNKKQITKIKLFGYDYCVSDDGFYYPDYRVPDKFKLIEIEGRKTTEILKYYRDNIFSIINRMDLQVEVHGEGLLCGK